MSDIWEQSLFSQGGLMMWPLMTLALVAILIFVERALFLHKGSIRMRQFLDGIKNLLAKRRLVEAVTLCEELPGPITNTIKAALMNFDRGTDTLKGAVQEAALVEIPLMERRLGTLSMVARVAPVIGMLGTVLSAFYAFTRLGNAGPYANTADFSGDIAQAMITTLAGLTVGVLSILAYYFLTSRVRGIVQDMEWAAHHVIQFLLNEMPQDVEGENEDRKG